MEELLKRVNNDHVIRMSLVIKTGTSHTITGVKKKKRKKKKKKRKRKRKRKQKRRERKKGKK